MKKLKICLLFCIALLSMTACGTAGAADIQDSGVMEQEHDGMKSETVQVPEAGNGEQNRTQETENEEAVVISDGFSMSDYYVQISMEGHTATFQLYDTTAAKELYDQLPLTLETSNFASAQWMFYPPEHLKVTDAETYHDGKKGELSYYDPWGDVFMLYEDFYAGDEMHRLGICIEGIEELEGMSGTILVEKAEENDTAEAEERMGSMMENTIKTREYRDVAYDTLSEAQKFDLYLPETGEGPFPLVMFIHGGGWFSGDKTDGQESAWVTLREQGYAVASINYRLSGETPHPSGIIDCKTALRYLKAHADKYHIDAKRIAVSGDSSGGHYALMVALTAGNPDFEDLTRGNPEQASDVACAVVWYPATDLSETMRTVRDGEYTGFGADFAWSNIERYAGKTIEDVNDNVLVSASPIQYVTEDMPPVLLQHGNADTICPIDQSRRIYRRMIETAGEDRVKFDVLDGAEHGDVDFETAENMERIARFLRQCGL